MYSLISACIAYAHGIASKTGRECNGERDDRGRVRCLYIVVGHGRWLHLDHRCRTCCRRYIVSYIQCTRLYTYILKCNVCIYIGVCVCGYMRRTLINNIYLLRHRLRACMCVVLNTTDPRTSSGHRRTTVYVQ